MFFELLEQRQLLSVSFNPGTGILTITEANGRDRVNISQSGNTLLVSEQSSKPKSFTNVSLIVIQDTASPQHAGRDSFILDPSVTVPASITGNGGHDTIQGGSGNDTLVTTGGNDCIVGGAGDDTILLGGTIDPTVPDPYCKDHGNPHYPGSTAYGGAGNDYIVGTPEDDYISGDAGNDTLHGGDGFDTVDGGADNDLVFGDAQGDSLLGGDGDDSISLNGPDTVDAGAGNDLVSPLLTDPVTGNPSAPVMGFVPSSSGGSLGAPVMSLLPTALPPSCSTPDSSSNTGASVNGGDGNDTLVGTPQDDTLNGGDGDDCISGNDGNDVLNGGDGNNEIDGGNGDDTISTGVNGSSDMHGDAGNDTFINDANAGNSEEEDTVDGGSGINIAQTDPNDFFEGDFLFADPSTQTGSEPEVVPDSEVFSLNISAQSGNATDPVQGITPSADSNASLQGSLLLVDETHQSTGQNVVVSQGASLFTVTENGSSIGTFPVASVTAVKILGSPAADNLSALHVQVPVTVIAGAGNDTIVGGDNNDVLIGESGNDLIQGQLGDDKLEGRDGNDTLQGGGGDDYLCGGFSDYLNGFANFYTGPDGADVIDGGDGNDWVDYRYRNDPVAVRLDGTARSGAGGEGDTVNANVENILGGAGNDILIGNGNANYISGGAGNDQLFGQGGNDQLVGGAGVDSTYGGAGADFFYISGDGFNDGYSFSGSTGDYLQKDAGDLVITNVTPPA
jgi:Ca2+-binding RTX toxin-like protein